jgi:hypothetical protein
MLLFSEWAQEPWVPAIPVLVICASYFVTTKGQAFTWGLYRLCQIGKDCLGMWPWLSSTLMESVFQESPHQSLATVNLSGQPSLCLSLSCKGSFLHWETDEKLQAHYSCKAGNLTELRGQPGVYTRLPILLGQSQTSVHWGFFSSNSQLPPSLNSFTLSRSDSLKRSSENSHWKGKFLFKL